ncbi:hypothetical protein [Rhodococcus wratislaviensis]|uniref:HEAT repeat-containing protein n=1 Tax=Rhodococcus wratislaviensis NBRC 100605 TaxID=1219028 RepID=X0Q5C0_RHOWR|nr:hypothetical protein [Rhodococcus wratislaviensis]GAF51523.1 hypothetical protein RW1_129_00020 [Rhodococcus wratislaviensis NBRC 100605]
MIYDELQPISRHETERLLASDDPEAVCRALVSAALFEEDWQWVESVCVRMANDPRPSVRGCAVTGLGHLARIHGVLDLDVVVPLLERLVADPKIGGRAEDALGDIRIFTTDERDEA